MKCKQQMKGCLSIGHYYIESWEQHCTWCHQCFRAQQPQVRFQAVPKFFCRQINSITICRESFKLIVPILYWLVASQWYNKSWKGGNSSEDRKEESLTSRVWPAQTPCAGSSRWPRSSASPTQSWLFSPATRE